MADLCIHPRIIDLMKKILGPNIVLLSSTIFTKYPPNENEKSENFAGDFVGWHQDLKYWGTTIFSMGEHLPTTGDIFKKNVTCCR